MLQCKSYRRLRDPTSEWSFGGETARFTDFCRSASLERSAVDRGCFSKCSPPPCNGQCSRAKTSWSQKEGGGGGGTVFGKQERLRDGQRKLAGSRIWQELRGDWFVGFVQPPEAGEPFGREGSSPGGTD